MNGRMAYMLAFALMIVAAAWIFVQSRGGDGAGAANAGGGRSPTDAGARPGGGSMREQATKRDRPAGREGAERTPARAQAAESFLSVAEAQAESRKLVEAALQLTDAAKRADAVEQIRSYLGGSDEMQAYIALQAYVGIKDLKMDRAADRELVERWLEAEDPGMRRLAWYAFGQTGPRPEDVVRVRALAEDPSEAVRKSASHLMSQYEKGDFTGASGDAVLGMLEREEKGVRREVLRGMWGASLSPELEAKVIELSRSDDPNEMHDAVYFALSTSMNKSSAAVDRLIEVLADPDVVNNAGRAAWGLRKGVAEADRGRVADAAMSLIENRRSGALWGQAVELLGRYGSSQHQAEVESLLADPGLDPRSRMSLQRVLEQLGGR